MGEATVENSVGLSQPSLRGGRLTRAGLLRVVGAAAGLTALAGATGTVSVEPEWIKDQAQEALFVLLDGIKDPEERRRLLAAAQLAFNAQTVVTPQEQVTVTTTGGEQDGCVRGEKVSTLAEAVERVGRLRIEDLVREERQPALSLGHTIFYLPDKMTTDRRIAWAAGAGAGLVRGVSIEGGGIVNIRHAMPEGAVAVIPRIDEHTLLAIADHPVGVYEDTRIKARSILGGIGLIMVRVIDVDKMDKLASKDATGNAFMQEAKIGIWLGPKLRLNKVNTGRVYLCTDDLGRASLRVYDSKNPTAILNQRKAIGCFFDLSDQENVMRLIAGVESDISLWLADEKRDGGLSDDMEPHFPLALLRGSKTDPYRMDIMLISSHLPITNPDLFNHIVWETSIGGVAVPSDDRLVVAFDHGDDMLVTAEYGCLIDPTARSSYYPDIDRTPPFLDRIKPHYGAGFRLYVAENPEEVRK